MRTHAALFFMVAAIASPLHGQPASYDYDVLATEVLSLRVKMLPIQQAGGPDAGWAEIIGDQADKLHDDLKRLAMATRMYEKFTCDDRRADARAFLRETAESRMASIEERYVITRMMQDTELSSRIRRGVADLEELYGRAEPLLRF